MKTHAMWAIATLSVAALTALVSRRDEKSAAPDPGLQRLEEKNAALRERVARLEAEIAGKALPPSAPESADPRPGKAPEPLRELPKVVGIEQIRALLKSGTREDLNKAFKEIEALPDRAEKLALLRDLLAGGDRQQGLRSVSILKKMGGADAAQLIAGVLAKDGPSDLRAQAAVALGERRTSRGAAQAARRRLTGMGVRVLGAALNAVEGPESAYGYYGYYYSYYKPREDKKEA